MEYCREMKYFIRKILAVTLTFSMAFISFAASSANAKVIAKCGGVRWL